MRLSTHRMKRFYTDVKRNGDSVGGGSGWEICLPNSCIKDSSWNVSSPALLMSSPSSSVTCPASSVPVCLPLQPHRPHHSCLDHQNHRLTGETSHLPPSMHFNRRIFLLVFLVAQTLKKSAFKAGYLGLIPGSGRSPGEGNSCPLQYSCLGNPCGQKSVRGYSPQCHTESDTTEET